MARAARHPDRLRPAVGRSRVRGDAGLRRQPVAAAAPDCSCSRCSAPRRPPTRRSSRCRTPTRPSARSPSTSSPSSVESDVKPRVFFDGLSRTASSTSATSRPAAAGATSSSPTTRKPDQTTVYFARERPAAASIARSGSCSWLLEDGTSHTTSTDTARRVRRQRLRAADRSTSTGDGVPAASSSKGDNEMTIAELREQIAENAKTRRDPAHSQRFMIQQKFSMPAACLVLALIGLALGASNRKDGKLASFVLGFGVIFVYYVLLYSLARGGHRRTVHARAGAVDAEHRARRRRRRADHLARRRRRPADSHQPPDVLAARRRRRGAAARRRSRADAAAAHRARRPHPAPRSGRAEPARHLHRAPVPARVRCWRSSALLGIFYISTFIDLADKLFRGTTTTGDAASLLLFPDAAVRLLHHSDGGARRDAGDRRRDDEEQRADRDARLRHQPVPLGRCRCCCSRVAVQRASCSSCRSGCSPTPTARRDRLNAHHPRLCRRRPSACSIGAGSSARAATSTTTTSTIRRANQFTRLVDVSHGRIGLAAWRR